MKQKVILFILLFISFKVLAAPANDNCSNAITLTSNSSCTTGTTYQGGIEIGENSPSCASTFNQSVWYKFTATSTAMFIQLETSGVYGGTVSPSRWFSAVYHTNTCFPSSSTLVSCQTANSVGTGDNIIENLLSGLTIGDTYYIQVGYGTGGGYNGVPQFCIRVGVPLSGNSTCQFPTGPACGYSTIPTTSQVLATCSPYNQIPYNEGSSLVSQCYTFIASSTTVSFNIMVTSTCSGGNVTNFTYSLYSTCGTSIQTGTLSNLTFPSLIPGRQYTFCYSFNVPSNCYHIAYYPYFVGASPLPVELLSFKAKYISKGVELKWSTASEINNDFFKIYKSLDGINYEFLTQVSGNGTTSQIHDYSILDREITGKIIYYKLVQIDYDGIETKYDPVAVECNFTTKLPYKVFNSLGQEVTENYPGVKFYLYK